jgi:hypothetical protein
VAAARDRIEGTQIPTNNPESLSTKNHRKTENRNEMNAAIKNSVIGRLFLDIDSTLDSPTEEKGPERSKPSNSKSRHINTPRHETGTRQPTEARDLPPIYIESQLDIRGSKAPAELFEMPPPDCAVHAEQGIGDRPHGSQAHAGNPNGVTDPLEDETAVGRIELDRSRHVQLAARSTLRDHFSSRVEIRTVPLSVHDVYVASSPTRLGTRTLRSSIS